MKVGVIARAEDRGLGIQTWEVCRALDPHRVLVVDMGELTGHFARRPEWFAPWDGMTVPADRMGDPSVVKPLIHDLDVIYFAETCYDWRFLSICRALRIATVCHLNPEFFGHHIDVHEPSPTQWWLPSLWLADDPRIPADAVYMPMPVPLDRWPTPVRRLPLRPLKILHVGGHPAMGDRNGTRALLASLRHIREEVEVTVTTQANALPSPRRPGNVTYRVARGVRDYWSLYDDHDVLVMPRRYGGLCLPAIEAAGAGLGLVMSDCPPNEQYPASLVGGGWAQPIDAKAGPIPSFTVDAQRLARTIDLLATDARAVEAMQARARRWAESNSWGKLRPRWERQLADAVRVERG